MSKREDFNDTFSVDEVLHANDLTRQHLGKPLEAALATPGDLARVRAEVRAQAELDRQDQLVLKRSIQRRLGQPLDTEPTPLPWDDEQPDG